MVVLLVVVVGSPTYNIQETMCHHFPHLDHCLTYHALNKIKTINTNMSIFSQFIYLYSIQFQCQGIHILLIY